MVAHRECVEEVMSISCILGEDAGTGFAWHSELGRSGNGDGRRVLVHISRFQHRPFTVFASAPLPWQRMLTYVMART